MRAVIFIFIVAVIGGAIAFYVYWVRGIELLPQIPGFSQGHAPKTRETVSPQGVKEKWDMRAPMPTERTEVGVAAVDGMVYVVGGLDAFGRTSDAVELYDPKTDSWVKSSPLPEGRHHAGVAGVGGKLYVVGGFSGIRFTPVKTLFIYDPKTALWKWGAGLPEARGAAAVAVWQNRIWVFGGNLESGDTTTVLMYDPAVDRWEKKTPMRIAYAQFRGA